MKNVSLLLFTLLLASEVCHSQSIDFELANPQPDLIDVYGGSFASGDIDGDGDADLLIAGLGPGQKTALYINDGSGNFTEEVNIPFPEASGSVTIFADLDMDGDLDLFMSGNGSSIGAFAHTYLNNGTGTFTQLANPSLPQFIDSGVGMADVDNDGDLDLLIAVIDENDTFIADLFLNNGNANFTPSGSGAFSPVKFASVEFFDVENDGDEDVLISGTQADNTALTSLYLNDGSGNFGVLSNANFEQLSADDVDAADTDNDGDFDLLMSGTNDALEVRTILYLNDGNGQFTELTSANLQQTFVGANALADFDNDGDQDILITGSQAGGLPNIFNKVYENLGNNEFIEIDTLGGEYLSACVVEDFNGDGLLDIIIHGFVDDTNVYWNNSQTFSIPDSGAMDNNMRIYPNPSDGVFFIDSNDNSTFSIEIFNTAGTIVHQCKYIFSSEPVQVNLPTGLYLLVVTADDYVKTSKIIIEK